MDKNQLPEEVKLAAQKWLDGNYDAETKERINYLLENDPEELNESFYKSLEFGTGGLRGIMGVGTNRMNIYTVGMATQGLANYLKQKFSGEIKVAVAHDCRNNSRLFAETTADVFSANGFKVILFDALRPTPELSFAIRHYGCQSGVVITASHNPKEYNGYKAYWDDGGQVISPHDKNIIGEVNKIQSIKDVNFKAKKENIQIVGEEFDEIYTDKIKALSLSPEVIARQKDLKIVYTPIHGTGVKLVPMVLKKMGFANVFNVPEQDVTDGNFPTVHSPNPEETAALNMAIEKAKKENADIVMGTDPDADRVGIVAKDNKGDYVILNGNQTASVLIYYLLTKWKENGKLKGKEFIAKTIVTTELLTEIADSYNVKHFHVLTGFKYIADIIKQKEPELEFIGGGEESYGYLIGDFVRDKDAVSSCAMIAETAAWAKDQGKSLFDILLEIYTKYSFYKERLISVVKKGKSGAEEIKAMMDKFRSEPPKTLAGSEIIEVLDYKTQKATNIKTNEASDIKLPVSDVLQYVTADGSKISVRPSGTEPKIKFYFSVKDKLPSVSEFDTTEQKLNSKIDTIIKELEL